MIALNDGCTYLLPNQSAKKESDCDSCKSCGGENFGNANKLPININLSIPLHVNNGHYNDVANKREYPMQQQQQQVIVPGYSTSIPAVQPQSGHRPVVVVIPVSGGGRREVELPAEIPIPPGNNSGGNNGGGTVLRPIAAADPEFDAWL